MPGPLADREFLSGDMPLDECFRKAVVDIGSNSVRLVIYDSSAVVPIPFFNEKVFCGIGRTLGSTGRLDDGGVQRAIFALDRFKSVIATNLVGEVQAVATAAVRDADNGKTFVEHAAAALGTPIRIIDGAEEGRLSALGVLLGIADADGLVCDLGGGSLEIARVARGRVGQAVTLPLGPLRLVEASKANIKTARSLCDTALEEARGLTGKDTKAIYLVGGNWRNLARVHMEHTDYPLKMLHQYHMPREEVLDLSRMIARQSKKSLEQINGISKKRAEFLPLGAVVLERLLMQTNAGDVVVSAHGLREGLLAEMLGRDMSDTDTLIETAEVTCYRLARDPELCRELIDWTAPLFPVETVAEKRLRVAACYLSDIMWRAHPDYRGTMIFDYIISTQFNMLDHVGRIFLATALHGRYPGGPRSNQIEDLSRLMPPEIAVRARILGHALRFGITLSGASSGVLPLSRLKLDDDHVQLEIPKGKRTLFGEISQRRLSVLAEALGRDGKYDLF